MLKHKIRLADGSVLTSGAGTTNAIRSVALTEQVENGTDVCPGAACAACAEIELWVPENRLAVNQGDELTLIRLDTDTGTETQAGIFLAEKPTKTSANVYKITAYDRMTLFDRDMTDWLTGRKSHWPTFWQSCAQPAAWNRQRGPWIPCPTAGMKYRLSPPMASPAANFSSGAFRQRAGSPV